MFEVFEQEGSIDGLRGALAQVEGEESVNGILILACDANQFQAQQVDPLLQSLSLPVFGGIFPGILYNGRSYEQGTLVVGLAATPQVLVIPGLSDQTVDYEDVLDQSLDRIGQGETMFVWVDGFSSRISALLEALFNLFGIEHNYIGGGAGSLSFEKKPCLLTNDGLIQDAAVLATVGAVGGIGVGHGWRTSSGPYRVTESARNVIKSLDWQPAFDIYRQVVERHTGEIFTESNFFDLAKRHPFGLYRAGAERIIRDPIVRDENGALVCVGEVPEGSYVDIMSGTAESLIGATKDAQKSAQLAYGGGGTQPTAVFIDCISRRLFLEERFQEEVEAVYDGVAPMVGALTLGEIANSRQDYLEFYNKTAVVGILEL